MNGLLSFFFSVLEMGCLFYHHDEEENWGT